MGLVLTFVSMESPEATQQLLRGEYLIKKVFEGVEDKPETTKEDLQDARDAREAEGAVDGEHLSRRAPMPRDMLSG